MTPTQKMTLARKAFEAYQDSVTIDRNGFVDIMAREIEAVIRTRYGLSENLAVCEDFSLTDAIAVAFIAGQMQPA